MIRMIAAVFALLIISIPVQAQTECKLTVEQARAFEADGKALPGRWFEGEEAALLTRAFNQMPPESDIEADLGWIGVDPQGRGAVLLLFNDGCVAVGSTMTARGLKVLMAAYSKLLGDPA